MEENKVVEVYLFIKIKYKIYLFSNQSQSNVKSELWLHNSILNKTIRHI